MCGPIYSFSQLVFEHLCARCFVGETRGNDMYGLRSCEAYILVGETAENTTTSTIKRENFRMWWGEGGSKQLMESRLARVGQKRLLWGDVIWNEPLGHEITHLCKGKGRELISTRVEMGNSVVWSRSWKQTCLPGVNGEKWSWRGGRKEDVEILTDHEVWCVYRKVIVVMSFHKLNITVTSTQIEKPTISTGTIGKHRLGL